jgi:hypothetical protein
MRGDPMPSTCTQSRTPIEIVSGAVVAPNSGTPGSQISSTCQAQLLGMLNAEHGTNLTDANVTGTYNNGTAANLLISATGLIQFLSAGKVYDLWQPILAWIRYGWAHRK